MRRTAVSRASIIASAALVGAGCGRSPQPPEPIPVAVRVEVLLPLHPAWRDYLAVGSSPLAMQAPHQAPVAHHVANSTELPRRLIYEVPGAPQKGPEPLASDERIEALRPVYERRNAIFVRAALRQRLREMEALRGPIAADMARSDVLADALYGSQWNEQVAPIEAKVLALQSQLGTWAIGKTAREGVQAELDADRQRAVDVETKLKLGLALRRADGVQRVLDSRDRETDAIRQELVLLEAERNEEVGRLISAYKTDVARSRQSIQPLTSTVVPRPVVATPPELREPPQTATAPLPAHAAAAPTAPIDRHLLLGIIRRDIERRIDRIAAQRGWRPVYSVGHNLPDRTEEVRRLLLAEDRP